jgi:predicted RNA-binding protein associated with RNAse of E/G family
MSKYVQTPLKIADHRMWKISFDAKHFEVQKYVEKNSCRKELYTHILKNQLLQSILRKPTCAFPKMST